MVLGEEDSLELNHVDDDDEEDGEHRDDNDDGTIISLSLATIFSERGESLGFFCSIKMSFAKMRKIIQFEKKVKKADLKIFT